MDKASLRRKYNTLRATLSNTERNEMSLTIANNALKATIWEQTTYHLFLSIEKKAEVDTKYLLHILQGRDKTIGISKANFTNGNLEHILLQENTKLHLSKYGIPEPESGITLDPSTFDVVFVPLLAYDTKGNRIGYGKGFYDRFLAQCKPSCVFVGLSFFKPEISIPYSELDTPLHMVITPETVYKF